MGRASVASVWLRVKAAAIKNQRMGSTTSQDPAPAVSAATKAQRQAALRDTWTGVEWPPSDPSRGLTVGPGRWYSRAGGRGVPMTQLLQAEAENL